MSRIVCACHYYPESLCPENEVTTQPEALRLADELKERFGNTVPTSQAAAELRRQHDEIEQLTAERDALKAAAEKGTEYVLAHINQDLKAERDALLAERDALLKATDKDSLTVQSRGEAMTDRELLELAAKAAGIDLVWDEPPADWPPLVYDGEFYQQWIPLDDDGDALRLAVKLGIDVDCDIAGGQTTVNGDFGWVSEMHNPDPYAATRRAIVRAAAEFGRAMK